jgi:hypothetical protein
MALKPKIDWMVGFAWVGLMVLLAGCASDPNDQFIQGSWYFNDPHLNRIAGESALETTWTFDRGAYQVYACCFVRSTHFGRYTILESQADTLVLELFNQDGSIKSERTSIKLVIDRENQTLKIQGGGPFTRIGP